MASDIGILAKQGDNVWLCECSARAVRRLSAYRSRWFRFDTALAKVALRLIYR